MQDRKLEEPRLALKLQPRRFLASGAAHCWEWKGVEHRFNKSSSYPPNPPGCVWSPITFGCVRLLKESILQEVFLFYLTLVSL